MHFRETAEYFDRIESASSRLKMTDLLAEMLSKVDAENIEKVVYMAQGMLAPEYESIELGLGEKLVEEAIARVYGYSRKEVNGFFKKKGDLGLVAEELLEKKKQRSLFSEKLTVNKVYENLLKIAKATGAGSQETKLKRLAELLNSSSPLEARYIARIALGNLRLGSGDPTIMDALAMLLAPKALKDKKTVSALEKTLKEKKPEKRKQELERRIRQRLRAAIEDKYNVRPDLGYIARLLKQEGLEGLNSVSIKAGIPIRPTLAERLSSAEEILKKIGRCAAEAKYDGFRFQVHKHKDKVTIFSRRQENMTHMFPEIVEAVKKQVSAKEAIIEGEALAFNDEAQEYFPFQVTIQRKRKYDIKKKAEEFPLKLFVFDAMYIDGKNLMNRPFKERRKALKGIIRKGSVIELTESIETDSASDINKFFNDSVEKGLEGIIAKDLNAAYIAGARKFAWIKLKRSYKGELGDSIDVVIVGYFKGKGHRTKFGLGALLGAVYDKKDDKFKSVTKIGTGMSENKMVELEGMLKKIKSEERPARVDSQLEPDFWVKPKYVVEVRADEITLSPTHTAGKRAGKDGLALRFPRMISIRFDKKPEDATSVSELVNMYKKQKRVKTESIG